MVVPVVRSLGVLLAMLASAGCVTIRATTPQGPATEDPRAAPFELADFLDDDGDGIPDELENYLVEQFAPEMRLAPEGKDWTRPANVDWYLPQVRMRFVHRLCKDDDVMAGGTVTADSMWRQQHRTASTLCSHTDKLLVAASSSFAQQPRFYLRGVNPSTVRRGIPPSRSDEWIAYAHVQKSSYIRPRDRVAAAYDIQVWFFYPYNDGWMWFDHEADWEHVTISVTADLAFVSAYFSQHAFGQRVDRAADLNWSAGTHVVGYSAVGTHASYPNAGTHRNHIFPDRCYDGGPVWRTWRRFVNIGERGRVLHDATWANFAGRWGRTGRIAITSGPVGPMYAKRWPIAGTEYPVPETRLAATRR